ncbi:MAG: phage tail tape measure protein, partial [Oscillibacter sp.]|nr:phage tail tape measure protein [Oscillibacter sp.]
MAGKRIQGITIEIGGDTTKLAASLKGVDSSISATKRALSDVDKLLKLDPSNTELLAQKQKLLGEAVSQAKERLAKLREASEAAAKTKDNYDAWKSKITPLWQEIEKASNHLKELKKKQEEMKDAGEVDSDAYKALQAEIDATSGHLKELREQAKKVTE